MPSPSPPITPLPSNSTLFPYTRSSDLAFPRLAFHPDPPVHHLHKPCRHGQAQAAAAIDACGGCVRLDEWNENRLDRKSTRLKSINMSTSYPFSCLNKLTRVSIFVSSGQ